MWVLSVCMIQPNANVVAVLGITTSRMSSSWDYTLLVYFCMMFQFWWQQCLWYNASVVAVLGIMTSRMSSSWDYTLLVYFCVMFPVVDLRFEMGGSSVIHRKKRST